jgi:hypothetical protein
MESTIKAGPIEATLYIGEDGQLHEKLRITDDEGVYELE